MQINKITTFLTFQRQSFALEWTKKLFKAYLKHTLRGANLSKQNSKISKKFLKMAENNKLNLVACLKSLNISLIKKYFINLAIGMREWGYSVYSVC